MRGFSSRLLCLLCVLAWAGAGRAGAETLIDGDVDTSTWTEAESPYHITSDANIPASAVLTLEPGVVVSLDAATSLHVRGSLQAAGTAEKSIRFVRSSEKDAWGGIVFSGDSAHGDLEYVEITGASKVQSERGAFNLVDGARVRLSHCWFHDFPGVVIDSGGGSELEVLDCLVEKSKEAIHSARSYALIERTTVRDVFGYSDLIDFDYDSTQQSVIRDCLLENNAEDDGIDLGSANPLVENVVIRGVRAGKAISMDGDSSPILRGILIYDCMLGIVSKDSCTPVISHCTVTRCEKAVKCYEKTGGRGGGHGTADSMIIWGNDESVSLDALSTFTMTDSAVEGGYDGEGNLDADPLFVNPEGDDFHIQPSSPAVGSGRDGSDMGALPVSTVPVARFVRGDSNEDGSYDVADPILTLLYLLSGAEASCLDALDADDTGSIDITDAIYSLQYLFLQGPPPPPPYPSAGPDPTGDDPYEC